MAAWRRKGGLEKFERKLKDGMRRNGYPAEFAEQDLQADPAASANTAFPNRIPRASRCSPMSPPGSSTTSRPPFSPRMLNSQPMGFYSPSQLVQDARRHGVEVRPVDVTVSDWECTLEARRAAVTGHSVLSHGRRSAGSAPRAADGQRPVRRPRPSGSSPPARSSLSQDVEDLARRAELDRRDLRSLAAAGALAALAGHRRNAHWLAAGAEALPQLLRTRPFTEPLPASPPRPKARTSSPTTPASG